jgi:hypothetical protein
MFSLILNATLARKTSDVANKLRIMSTIIQRFGKHFSCHLQDKYVKEIFGSRVGQRADNEFDLMVLVGAGEDRTATNRRKAWS